MPIVQKEASLNIQQKDPSIDPCETPTYLAIFNMDPCSLAGQFTIKILRISLMPAMDKLSNIDSKCFNNNLHRSLVQEKVREAFIHVTVADFHANNWR